MAEFYAVLRRAVSGLGPSTSAERRAVYEKARSALVNQLKAIDPPLTTAEISRRRLDLEEAIRRVERESAAEQAVAVAPAEAEPEYEAPPPPRRRPMPQAPIHTPPPQYDAESPQATFRRAVNDAEWPESRPDYPEEPSGFPADPRAPRRAAAADPYRRPAPADDYIPAEGGYRRGSPQREISADIGAPSRFDSVDSGIGEPRFDDDDGRGFGGPLGAPEPMMDIDEDEAPRRGSRRGRRGRAEADDSPRERRSVLPRLLFLLVLLGIIGGGVAFAVFNREAIGDFISSFDRPALNDNRGSAVTPPSSSEPVKADDRLLEPAPGEPVRVVGGSDQPDSAVAPAPVGPVPPAAGGGAVVAQRAALYEEPLANSGTTEIRRLNAAVTWDLDQGAPGGATIVANVTVPERQMTINLSLRKNSDSALPASHLAELIFQLPGDFPGGSIEQVPSIILKPTEEARGKALIGAAEKVTDGFFWFALANEDVAVRENLDLLRQRNWIDIPMVYANGQRAILTIEKGFPGEQAVNTAIAAWGN